VAILDGDLQDPPELIPEMIKIIVNEDYDVVYGIRKTRKESFVKIICYKLFYRIWHLISDIYAPLDAGNFCVMKKIVVNSILSFPENQRFTRGLRALAGFRQKGFIYDRQARKSGETKFSLFNMFDLAFLGLITFSLFPLRFMLISGLLISFASFLLGVVQILIYFINMFYNLSIAPIPGLTQVTVLITFLMGFNILCIGILGEYLGRVYYEVKKRPCFIVKDEIL
jgi:dolichol-phosphate mannosyltransferase